MCNHMMCNMCTEEYAQGQISGVPKLCAFPTRVYAMCVADSVVISFISVYGLTEVASTSFRQHTYILQGLLILDTCMCSVSSTYLSHPHLPPSSKDLFKKWSSCTLSCNAGLFSLRQCPPQW